MKDRELDVVLFGATGFTGRLVAEYLVAHAGNAKWAIAGRNRDKLEGVKRDLARENTEKSDIAILVGDSNDEASLREIVKRTRVVCTTVGPYAKYGLPLARVCAQEGVHYTDLTGEVPFMRASIDENHATAEKSGAKIVHACGFDSVPSDLGTYLLYLRAKEENLTLGRTTLMVRKMSGGFSGGTLASMTELMDAAKKDPAMRKLVINPHALDPEAPPRDRRDDRDKFGASFDSELRAWTAPFVMSMVNSRVVRRTNALFHGGYGADFRYREVMSFRPGARGAVTAALVSAATAGFAGAMSIPITRKILETKLPKPGEGPSEIARKKGSFSIQIVSLTKTKSGGEGPSLAMRVDGEGDPGYDATSRMIGEASLCLAQDELPARAGVLTPAFAMGDALAARLNNARVRFTRV